jgi:hypothetical protein
MEMTVDRVDLWVASIPDEPGELARRLQSLKEAGADLDFVITRRDHDNPGHAVVYIDPLRRDREIEAAKSLGFKVSQSSYTLRLEGDNYPGIASDLAAKIADQGINLKGFTGAVCGSRFIVYLGFYVAQEADRAMEIVRKLGAQVPQYGQR